MNPIVRDDTRDELYQEHINLIWKRTKHSGLALEKEKSNLLILPKPKSSFPRRGLKRQRILPY